MLRLTLCLLTAAATAGTTLAKPPKTPPPAKAAKAGKTAPAPAAEPWTVRSYRFPSDSLVAGFDTKDQGRLKAPVLPTADASAEKVAVFLKKSHACLSAFFTGLGYAPPAGSLLVFDPDSATLVARTTVEFHDLLEAVSGENLASRSMRLASTVQIIEADADAVRDAVAQADKRPDHAALLATLTALVDAGKARIVSDQQAETRSGQKVKVGSTNDRRAASDFDVAADSSSVTNLERNPVGTTLELEPTMGADGETIDVAFFLDHHFAPPVESWITAGARLGTKPVEARAMDFSSAMVNSNTSLLTGQTKLLSVWSPAAGPAKVLQAAFLTMDAVRVLPLENPQLAAWMSAHGELALPTPKSAPPRPEGLPEGMIIRLFHVTSDMLRSVNSPGSYSDTAGGADPFAAPASPASEPRLSIQASALDILKSLGVPFPEGSSATFNQGLNVLLVRNTPENIEFVRQAFSIRRQGEVAKYLAVTTQIVQADAALVRQWQRESRPVADHSGAWKSAQAAVAEKKASVVDMTWLETRSGQKAKAEAGTTFSTAESDYSVSESKSTEDAPAAATQQQPALLPPPPQENKGGAVPSPNPPPPQAKPVVVVASRDHEIISATVEREHIGTTVEVEPVIGADGHMVDLSMQLDYDYAPPTQRPSPEAAAGAALRPEAPVTEFHHVSLSFSTPLLSGSWRLAGVWKPTGTADFDGKEILQAAFVKVTVLPIRQEKP